MKRLILLGFTLFATLQISAQCTPQAEFGDEPYGVQPDTVENFDPGEENVLYIQQIDVKIPEDVEVGPLMAMVDSARVLEIQGIPPGLELVCNGDGFDPCSYLGGTIGCALITGVPTLAGTYDIAVNVMMYGVVFGTSVEEVFSFDGYQIVVSGTSSVAEISLLGSRIEIQPNPANAQTQIKLSSSTATEAKLYLYDMVGKQVIDRKVNLVQGNNSLKIDTSVLPQGIYICRVDAAGESVSSRLVISR